MTRDADRPLSETLIVFAVVSALTVGITQLGQALPGLSAYVQLLVGAVFLLVAVRLARRQPGGMRHFGIDLAGLLTPPDADDERAAGPLGLYDLGRALRAAAPSGLKETLVAVGVAAVVFPPFVVGFHAWYGPSATFELRFPDELGAFVLTQLIVVALPEEAFFRGYVQTRLANRFSGEKWRIKVDPRVLLLQAALFALIHLASDLNPAKLAVFFPALLFGLMRAWRGGIGAAMLLHALSNLLAAVLEASWQIR